MNVSLAIVETIIAILAGGLSIGIVRKFSARMQRRVGPSILQAFYDVIKLFSKEFFYSRRLPVVFAISAMLFQIASVFIVVYGGDTMMAFFVSGAGSVYLAAGAFSSPSIYSWLGGRRELLAIVAYEPIIFVLALAVSTQAHNVLLAFPAVFIATIPVLSVLLERSPYDVSAAHQEIVGGPIADYAGPMLGILNVARWAQLAFVYILISMLIWSANQIYDILLKILLVLISIIIVVVIDNTTARANRRVMVISLPLFSLTTISANLAILYIIGAI